MASLLRRLEPEDAVRAALILTGKVFPAWDERSLDVSWATIWRVVESLVSARPTEVRRVASEGVDLGDAVRRVFEAFPRRRQATLFEEELTLREVYAQLEAISLAVGPGSRARKEVILRSLLSRVSPPCQGAYPLYIILVLSLLREPERWGDNMGDPGWPAPFSVDR